MVFIITKQKKVFSRPSAKKVVMYGEKWWSPVKNYHLNIISVCGRDIAKRGCRLNIAIKYLKKIIISY